MKITNLLKKIIFEETQKLQERTETPFSRANIKTIIVRIFYDDEVPTYDILTGTRVIENVATVYSIGPSHKSVMGREILDAKINYIPIGFSHAEYIDFLAQHIKNIKGIKMVKILKIGKKRLTQPVGPIKLTY